MKRRKLLQLGASAALWAMFPRKADATTYAMKGIVANEPSTVNLLAPQWTRSSFGLYLMDFSFGATKLALDCATVYSTLDAANTATLMQHPSYDGWWIIGFNEPDLQGITAQNAAAKIVEHANLILSVDPLAKFTIAGLSQINACFKVPYFWTLWSSLTLAVRSKVRAINVHYYPQAAGITDGNMFKPAAIINYLNKTRASLNSHGLNAMEIWLTEIGLSQTAFTATRLPQVADYPRQIKIACQNGLATRWAIYLQEGWGQSGYHCLMDNGILTPMGTTFKSV